MFFNSVLIHGRILARVFERVFVSETNIRSINELGANEYVWGVQLCRDQHRLPVMIHSPDLMRDYRQINYVRVCIVNCLT